MAYLMTPELRKKALQLKPNRAIYINKDKIRAGDTSFSMISGHIVNVPVFPQMLPNGQRQMVATGVPKKLDKQGNRVDDDKVVHWITGATHLQRLQNGETLTFSEVGILTAQGVVKTHALNYQLTTKNAELLARNEAMQAQLDLLTGQVAAKEKAKPATKK